MGSRLGEFRRNGIELDFAFKPAIGIDIRWTVHIENVDGLGGRIGLVSQLPDVSLHPVVGALKRLLLCIQLIGDVAIGQCVSASRWRKLLFRTAIYRSPKSRPLQAFATPTGWGGRSGKLRGAARRASPRRDGGASPVNFPELSYFRIGQSGA